MKILFNFIKALKFRRLMKKRNKEFNKKFSGDYAYPIRNNNSHENKKNV